MTLYDHVDDYYALRQLLDEVATDEDGNPKEIDEATKATLAEMADQWKGDFQAKAERVCRFRADVQAHIDACRIESQRLAGRARVNENRLRALNYLILISMSRLGIKKLDAGTFAVTVAKNPPALLVRDEEKLDPVFFDVIPEHRELNKARLKEALKDGATVEGAELVQDESVRVK